MDSTPKNQPPRNRPKGEILPPSRLLASAINASSDCEASCNCAWRSWGAGSCRLTQSTHSFVFSRPSFATIKRPDVIEHPQEFEPLLLGKRHGKTPHPVGRECALLADFHGNAGGSALFERSVLVTQPLQLGLQIVVLTRPREPPARLIRCAKCSDADDDLTAAVTGLHGGQCVRDFFHSNRPLQVGVQCPLLREHRYSLK
jgi:hypothetical protein